MSLKPPKRRCISSQPTRSGGPYKKLYIQKIHALALNPSDAGEGNCLPVGYAVRGVEDQPPFDGVDGFYGALGLQEAAAVLAVLTIVRINLNP